MFAFTTNCLLGGKLLKFYPNFPAYFDVLHWLFCSLIANKKKLPIPIDTVLCCYVFKSIRIIGPIYFIHTCPCITISIALKIQWFSTLKIKFFKKNKTFPWKLFSSQSNQLNQIKAEKMHLFCHSFHLSVQFFHLHFWPARTFFFFFSLCNKYANTCIIISIYIHLHLHFIKSMSTHSFTLTNTITYYIQITHITHKAKHIHSHTHSHTHWDKHAHVHRHIILLWGGFAWSVAFVFCLFIFCVIRWFVRSLARPRSSCVCVCVCSLVYVYGAQWWWVLLIHAFALCTSRHRYHHHRGHDTQSLYS